MTVLALGALAAGCSGTDTCEAGLCGSGGGGSDAATGTTTTTTTTSGSTTQSGNPTSSTTQSGGGDGGGSGAGGDAGSTGGGGAGDGGNGSGGEGGGSTDLHCTPEELGDNEAPSEECGIFVDLGFDEDTQDGSPDNPYDSLEQALTAAREGERIYVCGRSEMPLVGPFVIDQSVELYGGWGCAQWTKFDAVQGKTEWRAPVGQIPLRITGDDTVLHLQGFDVRSENASPGDSGASSIAMVVHQAAVSLADMYVEAGDGAGGDSAMFVAAVPADHATMDGVPGTAGCFSTAIVPGTSGGLNSCGGTATSGGSGGSGTTITGGAGTPGAPLGLGGTGGVGDDGGVSGCSIGGLGTAATLGTPAVGADGNGVLSASGFVAAAGSNGTAAGGPGAGGGGGGGAKGCTSFDPDRAGSSGGGGGAGGCGGAVGAGGDGGGASIGIAVVGGAVTLVRTEVATGAGGAGGDGSAGQPGQEPGIGGTNPDATSCAGRAGRPGGDGGSGSGGRGGHSLPIATTQGGSATVQATTNLVPGTAGDGGTGGQGVAGNVGGDGADGVALDQYAL